MSNTQVMSGLLSKINSIPNPCFVLDEFLFERNMKLLKRVEQESGASVFCALKGFAMWEVFPLAMDYISGGTASSLNEVKLINEKMNRKAHACFVVYEQEEFKEVNKLSSHVIFNSISQFEKFKSVLNKNVQYAFRINPEFSNVAFNQYNPCTLGSRFGITKEMLKSKLPDQISGLHFHTLCESSAEDFEDALIKIEENFVDYLHQVSWVNFGGGHHITKDGYAIDLLIKLLKRVRDKYNVDVYIEPGEAIGLNAGYLTSKVEDVVKVNGINTAVLNVSFAAHMPDCLEMPYKPNVVSEVESGLHKYNLGGNTCMSGDFVSGFSFDKELKEGDLIVFEDMAHYTFVKTNFFNGVNHPSIGIWTKNKEFKLLRQFGYEDFKERLS